MGSILFSIFSESSGVPDSGAIHHGAKERSWLSIKRREEFLNVGGNISNDSLDDDHDLSRWQPRPPPSSPFLFFEISGAREIITHFPILVRSISFFFIFICIYLIVFPMIKSFLQYTIYIYIRISYTNA